MEKINKKLDIDNFKRKAKIVGSHYSIDSTYNERQYQDYELEEVLNNKIIRTWGSESSGFFEEIKYKDNPIIEYNNYMEKGNLIHWTKQSFYGFLIEEKEYDDEGYLINQINYDNIFKFSWEKVEEYLKKHNVDTSLKYFTEHPYPELPQPRVIRIYKKESQELNELLPTATSIIWYINNVEGIYKEKQGIYDFILDGNTGEELLIRRFKGKKSGANGIGTYADYEILYNAKK